MIRTHARDFVFGTLLSLFYYGFFFVLFPAVRHLLRIDSFEGFLFHLFFLIPVFIFTFLPVLFTTKQYVLNKDASPIWKMVKRFSLVSAVLFILPTLYLYIHGIYKAKTQSSGVAGGIGMAVLLFFGVSAFLLFCLCAFVSSTLSFYMNKKSSASVSIIILFVFDIATYLFLFMNLQ